MLCRNWNSQKKPAIWYCNRNCKCKDKGLCLHVHPEITYIIKINYINIIHNQIDNYYSVCPAAF